MRESSEIALSGANNATMTSQQIAELVGSRHDSVKRTIERLGTQRNLNENPIIQLPPLVEVKNHLGQTVLEYVFSGEQGERDSYVVVAQLSPEFTARLVDEWKRLKNAKAIPQSFSEALQLAADQAKQLELAAPKVSYYDKVVERDTLLNATQVGQKVGLSAVMLNRHLDDLGVYNQSIKRGRAFRQSFVDAGHGIMRQTDTGHAQPMITLSGEAWIIERLSSDGII